MNAEEDSKTKASGKGKYVKGALFFRRGSPANEYESLLAYILSNMLEKHEVSESVVLGKDESVESRLHEGIGRTVYVRHFDEKGEDELRERCTFEFVCLPGTAEQIEEDFKRFCFLTFCNFYCSPLPGLMGPGQYFVSLTFPDLRTVMNPRKDWKAPSWIESPSKDEPSHDGLEVRADLLADRSTDSIMNQLALVRRCGRNLPIIFTVRSKKQGGAFPDDEDAAWKLMMVGLKFGCDYIDMEACWTRSARHEFLRMAKSVCPSLKVIGSYHAIQRTLDAISDRELRGIFRMCADGPDTAPVDYVKVVGRAKSVQCSIRMNQTALSMKESLPNSVLSIVAICTTDPGRLSRALNVTLGPTPVAHPSMPGRAAPGQLSAKEIEDLRFSLGLERNPLVSGR